MSTIDRVLYFPNSGTHSSNGTEPALLMHLNEINFPANSETEHASRSTQVPTVLLTANRTNIEMLYARFN